MNNPDECATCDAFYNGIYKQPCGWSICGGCYRDRCNFEGRETQIDDLNRAAYVYRCLTCGLDHVVRMRPEGIVPYTPDKDENYHGPE